MNYHFLPGIFKKLDKLRFNLISNEDREEKKAL